MADEFEKFAGIFPIARAESSEGAIPMSLEEFGQAEYAVEQALVYGNYAPLEERLRVPSAKHLPLELNIAADIIAGKIKRPNHRIPQHPEALNIKRIYLALCVRVMMDKRKPRKAAVTDVAKENRVSPSTVSAAVRENPGLFIGCPQYK
jgi:hypothetical protein